MSRGGSHVSTTAEVYCPEQTSLEDKDNAFAVLNSPNQSLPSRQRFPNFTVHGFHVALVLRRPCMEHLLYYQASCAARLYKVVDLADHVANLGELWHT